MLSPPDFAVDNVSVGYDPKNPVLNRVTLRIDTDDRIALLGSNGNANRRWSSCSRIGCRLFRATITRAEKFHRLFCATPARRVNEDGFALRSRPQADAGRHGRPRLRGRTGAIGFSGKAGDTLVRSLGGERRGCCWDLRLSSVQHDHSRRADQHLDIDSRARLPKRSMNFPARSSWSRMIAI